MAGNSKIKTPMPEQQPELRNKNFEEVALGYTEEMAVQEALRCLHCKNRPCVDGCPVGVMIPEFIKHIADKDFSKAAEIISEANALPAICGRVCPQENQCEKVCLRGRNGEPVGIGRLERFAADWEMKNNTLKTETPDKNGMKAAIIGAGPAGLTCAGELAKKGYDVDIFEAIHTPGGVLVYGIPEFRLPKDIVAKEIAKLEQLGVNIFTNIIIGKTLTVDELFDRGYKSVFIGSGAGLPKFMDIPGEDLLGVYSANEYLSRINLMKAYRKDYDTPIAESKTVAVVGGGNVAMDAARCAKRLGAEVYIIYRRGKEELPARAEEVHHAKQEGIIFKLLNNPVEIIGDDNGYVKGIRCIRMSLGEPDESGRRSPVEVKGSEFMIDVDTVIMAIGNSPNPLLKNETKDLAYGRRGTLIIDEDTLMTSKKGVFAGGDVVTGSATVILAMSAGKCAASAMDEYMRSL